VNKALILPSSENMPSSAALPTMQRSTWGMWSFLASDAMTFAALLASAGILRRENHDWPSSAIVLNLWLAVIMTILLLVSSVFLVNALSGVKRNDHTRFRKYLLFTILCGAAFVVLQSVEWNHLLHEGMTMTQNPWGAGLFGATFYVLTGFHGLHVLGGVLYLTGILWTGLRGRYNANNYAAVEIAGLYWHFVDIVWIFVFVFVYLL
jgi:heme/copper-type cytochrome/quinol oxidase subunit 3